MSDFAKRIADKYIATDGGPPIPPLAEAVGEKPKPVKLTEPLVTLSREEYEFVLMLIEAADGDYEICVGCGAWMTFDEAVQWSEDGDMSCPRYADWGDRQSFCHRALEK